MSRRGGRATWLVLALALGAALPSSSVETASARISLRLLPAVLSAMPSLGSAVPATGDRLAPELSAPVGELASPLALPASAVSAAPLVPEGLPASYGFAAPEEAASGPKTLVAHLQGFVDKISATSAQVDPIALAARFSGKLFDQAADGSGFTPGAPGSGDSSGPPKLPPGVLRVSVDEVHEADDIDRLIPYGPNSWQLAESLKLEIARMVPYRIYTYHDAVGGKFTGIDLSANPRLVEVLPEQHSHEVRLIKKIQAWNQDLQVLVREDGKTPDLVLGGVVTELKSLIGNKVDLTYLVNKANTQVLEHAQRHRLGAGAAVIDLTEEDHVPVAKVLDELNAWSRMPEGTVIPGVYFGPRRPKTPVVLEQIYVFAGDELKAFVRRPNGTYRVARPDTIRHPSPGPQDPKAARVVAGARIATPNQLWLAYQVAQIVEGVSKRVERRHFRAALKLWENFSLEHSELEVDAAYARLRGTLAKADQDYQRTRPRSLRPKSRR